MLTLSQRARILEESPLHSFFRKASSFKDVIHLEVGDPNFPLSEQVKNAIFEGFRKDWLRYTPAGGLKELRELVALDFQKSGIKTAQRENTIVGPGAKTLIGAVFWAICSPGDRILIPAPFYPSYPQMVKNFGAIPVFLDTSKDDFQLNGERIKEIISQKKIKGIVLNSPNNPTGVVWDWKQLKDLPDNIWVIVDEVYQKIVYEKEYLSFASLPKRADQTITVRSFSKRYAMAGLRIGYLTGPQFLVEKIERYLQAAVGCPCSISQRAAISALKGPQNKVKEMIEELDRRRKYLIEWLKKHKLSYPYPEGAFYIFADFSKYSKDSFSLAELILNKARVALTPGIAFGYYPSYLRISYGPVSSFSELKKALKRVEKVLAEVRK